MDDLERKAYLTVLQLAADGPRQNLELRECSRGKALACAVLGVAGGLRVKLWVCALSLDGQRVGFDQLPGLLLAYIEAAQARRTLGQLFPQTVRFDAGR